MTRLRGLAVTSAQRSNTFAQIPTIAEAGFKDFDVSPWFGLFAPAKTPAAVVRRLRPMSARRASGKSAM